MFIAAWFIIAKTWKHSKCSLTDEHLNKMWSVDTMEYDLATKRNEVLIHMTKRMNPDDPLSEESQS